MIRALYPGSIVLLAALCGGACAQNYPAKPVRILVGFAPGGGTDIMARAVGAKLADALKQQFIVDNRPGANANLAAKLAAEAPADGYTILFMSVAHIMSKPVYKNLGYDIERDLAPITVVSNVPNVLVVHPSLPAKTVKEFIALARAKPGALTYATSGVGSPEHFAGEMFRMMTKTDLLAIPYKGGGPIAIDLVGGQVMASFSTMPAIIPYIRSGRVRAVAVTMEKRAAVLPDVPTVAESGYPGFEVTVWYGVCAPAGVPKPILAKLSRTLLQTLNMPETKARLAQNSIEAAPTTPAEFLTFIKSEAAKFAKVVKDAGIPRK